jgi:hypothetical protein
VLLLGHTRLCFVAALQHWTVADYERQWREGIARLAAGEASTALMTAYRGPGDRPHVMWALWRDESHVYIQEQTVLPAELDTLFDPRAPYQQVGNRVAATEAGLPISEWRIELVHLLAEAYGIRWPRYLT